MKEKDSSQAGLTYLEPVLICENRHCLKSSFEVFMSGGLPVPSHSENSWLTSASLDLISQLLADKRSPVTRREYEKDLRYFFKVISGKDQPTPELVSEFLTSIALLPCHWF
jgi:hypothetical protein